MRTINFAISSVLVTTLFAGCALEDEGQAADDNADQAAQEDPGVPGASDDATVTPVARDARAALEAESRVLSPLTVTPVALSSWYSGSVAPGVTQHWVWNN